MIHQTCPPPRFIPYPLKYALRSMLEQEHYSHLFGLFLKKVLISKQSKINLPMLLSILDIRNSNFLLFDKNWKLVFSR